MSTLFLIGNGFDLNCGMKTKYTDVYKKYVNEKSNSSNIKKFKQSISGDLENWGDFEMAMAEYAQCLEDEVELLECVRDFAIYMENYLIKENDSLKSMLTSKNLLDLVIQEFMRSLKVFCADISHNIDITMESRNATYIKEYEAISFNYTDIFDQLWNEVLRRYQLKKDVTHIHGVLGDGPVFGVDSNEQIKTKYKLSRRGERGFVKPTFNNEYDQQRVNEAKQKIQKALTICVFGMSLGESDLSWRNEIIDWLRRDENHHLFLYRYNVSQAKFATVTEKMDKEDDEKEELLLEWGISDMESIYNQIHIPCGKNIFNIGSVLGDELHKIDETKQAELKKKIEKGKEFVEKNSQTIMGI